MIRFLKSFFAPFPCDHPSICPPTQGLLPRSSYEGQAQFPTRLVTDTTSRVVWSALTDCALNQDFGAYLQIGLFTNEEIIVILLCV